MANDAYLGDGLYVTYDGRAGHIELYASDGISKTNRVFLDAAVLAHFKAWLKRENLG